MLFDSSRLTRREAVGGILAGAFTSTLILPRPATAAEPTRVAAAEKTSGSTHPLLPGLAMARESRKLMEAVKDYTGTFHKQELVGRTMINNQIEIKVREAPFSVYLKFIKPEEGREVVYVQGQNDGRMLAHGIGVEKVVGTLKMEPTSKRAMEESRYPITMIGIRRMLDTLIEQWEGELKLTGATVKVFPNAKVGSVDCRVFESSYAQPSSELKFHMTRLYVQREDGMPVRVEQFAFPVKAGSAAGIVEQYTYLDVKKNVGLTDIDFDDDNKAYDF